MTDATDRDRDEQHDDRNTQRVERTDPETLRELATRRGLYFPATEAHGAVAGLYTYGPVGAALKRNVEDAWRERFVLREGNREIDSPTVVPGAVFEASGHLEAFDDYLVACPDCDRRHRADSLVEAHATVADAESLPREGVEALLSEHDVACPDCGGPLAGQPVRDFGLLFETTVGPGDGRRAFLRPETAQGTLVEFPRLKEYARGRLPFGVAQVGRGYRNEISPRGSLLRLRELTLAELQRFVHPTDDEPPLERVEDVPLRLYPADVRGDAGDESDDAHDAYVEATPREAAGDLMAPWLAYYLGATRRWLERVGVDPDRLRFRQHRAGELAHYASDCWDAEALVHGVRDPDVNDGASVAGTDEAVATEDDVADAHGTDEAAVAGTDGTAPGAATGDWIELAGVARRADHDLANHAAQVEADYAVFDPYDEPETVEEATVEPDMSALGPAFGADAPAVVEALSALAASDPAAFDGEVVSVEVDGEPVEVPTGATGFAVERRTVHGEHVRPHVYEPAFGVDRVVYAVLAHSLRRDELDGEPRTRLALSPELAPAAVAVLPLRDEQAERARELVADLRARGLATEYDGAGSIGRRYRRQDEVGTPFCVTLDERTTGDGAATIRERDSTAQVRVPLSELPAVVEQLRDGESTFDAVRERFEAVASE